VRVGERAASEPDWVACLYYDADRGGPAVRRIPRDDPDLDTSDPRKYVYRGQTMLTSMSHLRIARSRDGEHFAFDDEPAIFPASPYEAFGCEDARITPLNGAYYVTYTAVSDRGVTVALARTEDFRRFDRLGVIFPPYNKDVAIFPATVGGMYVARHRPYKSQFNPASIWTAYSPDMSCWGRHEMTLAPTPGTWESDRVGAGAPPIRTDAGWLEIYHASDANGRYALGAMLSDPDRPERIISRSPRPVLEPQAPYELSGLYNHCVFHNGLVADDDGTLWIYYGAADRICAGAVTSIDEMIDAAGG